MGTPGDDGSLQTAGRGAPAATGPLRRAGFWPVRFLAVLGPLLASCALAGADAGWVSLLVSQPAASVHRCSSSNDSVIAIELSNLLDRSVRVGGVRVAYMASGLTLRVDRRGENFFSRGLLPRSARIERGRHVVWRNVCLESVPEGATQVIFEIDLAVRRGLRTERSTARVELPLAPDPAPRSLRLPFDGYWRVTQGHECNTLHRLGGLGQDLAWDFAALDERTGRDVTREYAGARRNQDTASFGRAVLAPADGTVVAVVDGRPDNEGLVDYPERSVVEEIREPDWAFGNYIVLDLGGAWALLGHLRRGSARVSPGVGVRAGEPLALAGNSGNSVMPHLHLHLMDRPDPNDPGVSGIPAVFRDYVEITVIVDRDRQDAVAKRVASGDPPTGSIVVP